MTTSLGLKLIYLDKVQDEDDRELWREWDGEVQSLGYTRGLRWDTTERGKGMEIRSERQTKQKQGFSPTEDASIGACREGV